MVLDRETRSTTTFDAPNRALGLGASDHVSIGRRNAQERVKFVTILTLQNHFGLFGADI